mmetsp:Transcript_11293/g.30767  ORF Transcript_11293/g.30767 Transcript_11293/m.30767 type:complete len:220 (+) Transcript_11293:386-1045(+)
MRRLRGCPQRRPRPCSRLRLRQESGMGQETPLGSSRGHLQSSSPACRSSRQALHPPRRVSHRSNSSRRCRHSSSPPDRSLRPRRASPRTTPEGMRTHPRGTTAQKPLGHPVLALAMPPPRRGPPRRLARRRGSRWRSPAGTCVPPRRSACWLWTGTSTPVREATGSCRQGATGRRRAWATGRTSAGAAVLAAAFPAHAPKDLPSAGTTRTTALWWRSTT